MLDQSIAQPMEKYFWGKGQIFYWQAFASQELKYVCGPWRRKNSVYFFDDGV